mgnify:CR=1 FL=1
MKVRGESRLKGSAVWFIAVNGVVGCLLAAWFYTRRMPWTDCLVALVIGLASASFTTHLCLRALRKFRDWLSRQAALLRVPCALREALKDVADATEVEQSGLAPAAGAQVPLGVALQECVQALEAQVGVIMLWDKGRQQLTPIARYGFAEVGTQDAQPIKPGSQLQERALVSGEPLVLTGPEEIASLGDDPVWREIATCLCIPLLPLGRTIGILVVGHRQRRKFTPAEIESLQVIGWEMGMAMANLRLYEQNRRAMEELAILQEIDQQVATTLDADEVCQAVVKGACRLIPADVSFLGLRRPTGELALSYASGVQTAAFRETCWGEGEGLLVQGRDAFVVTDRAIHPPASDPGGFIAAEGLRAWIGAPFQGACPVPARHGGWGEIEGILYVANRRATSFNSHQAQLLANLAARTAIAIANAVLFRTVERSKQEWEGAIDAIEELLLVLNPDYTIRRCNRAAAEALGLTPQQVVGRKCCQLFHHQPQPVEDCPVAKSLRTGERAFVESTDPHTRRVYHKWACPLLDTQGQVWAVVEYSRDVTAFQQAQAQLLQQEKLSALRQTISGAAHELNNPLTVIMGYAQLLQDTRDPQEMKQGLSSIHRQAQRARQVVQNLLTFAPVGEMHEERRVSSRQKVDVNQLLQHALALRAYTLRQKQVDIITNLESDLPWIEADTSRLQQAFLNIITNAEQALEQVDGPRQLIACTRLREEGDILVSFTDSGPGIPPSAFGKLFTPFFTTQEAGKGWGLGLSTSYGIVQEHGGRIWAQNNPGAGATFFVTLPRSLRDETATAASGEVSSLWPKTTRPRILVIDDEYSIVALLQRFLEPLGYEVDGALEGDIALSLLGERIYDLVITDVKMPGTDGRQLYALISERYPMLRRKVIFATGDTANGQTQHFLRQRGVPWLTKPFEMEEVQRLVQERIRETF